MKHLDAKARAKLLKAVANPIRLMMVYELSRGDRCATELRTLARVTPATISRHLAHLKRAGLVTTRRVGPHFVHHLEKRCILQALDCALGVLRSAAARK